MVACICPSESVTIQGKASAALQIHFRDKPRAAKPWAAKPRAAKSRAAKLRAAKSRAAKPKVAESMATKSRATKPRAACYFCLSVYYGQPIMLMQQKR